MLVITTTNVTGLDLFAVIDKVTTAGALLSPAERWNEVTEDWELAPSLSDSLVALTEDATISGLYSRQLSLIDGLTENLRITILDDSNVAIGTAYSIPIEGVNPEVVIDFTVTESR
jgi:hypothetical protein